MGSNLVSPSQGLGKPIPPIPRVGRVIQIQVNATANLLIPVTGNAFYVIDSPYPLLIKSDISPQSAYPMQMGESYPQQISKLYVISAVNQGGSVFYAKIWVGPDSHIGIIDNRTQFSTNSIDYTTPGYAFAYPAAPGISILANATAQAVQLSPRDVTRANIIGAVISNNDTTNTVFLCTVEGYVICPIFPQQVYSLPYPLCSLATSITASPPADFLGPYAGTGFFTMYFTNTTTSAISIFVSFTMRAASFNLESTS